MTRVLLTTVFRPFGVVGKYNKKGDEELLDYLSSRLTREPGLFALSSYVPASGLHLLAANLPAKTRVLEWPSIEEFVAELKKQPDYVGITFLIKGFGKLAKMIALTRKHAPKAKVVVGGFGTALHAVKDLGPDYISTGEGVRFMREVLGASPDLPYVHPHVSADITLKIFQNYNFLRKQTIGLIPRGFGCPHACDFCSTSAYFGYRSVGFLKNGRELYEAMKSQYRASKGTIDNFLIYEEDLMLYYKRKLAELGQCIEDDREATFSYAGFASVKALSKHDIEKLVAQGFGHVWIGVESSSAPYKKRDGRDVKGLFDELHSLGVTTTGSIIFGLDHHVPEQLPGEVDFLSSLRPSTAQISNLMPAIGTKLRERLEDESRIMSLEYKDADLFSEIVSHPNFRPGELTPAIFSGYNQLYDAIGPSIYRIVDTWFTGYKNLRNSLNSSLRRRANLYAGRVKEALPLFLRTGEYLPNEDIRRQVTDMVDEVIAELGPPSSEQQAQSELIARIFALEDIKRQQLEETPNEPELSVRDYAPTFLSKEALIPPDRLTSLTNVDRRSEANRG